MIALAMLGAGIGAAARWWLDGLIRVERAGAFPLGIWTINVLGSLLLGALLVLTAAGSSGYALLATGVCGGFTTFSTFSYETVVLFDDGFRRTAVVNVVASVVAGLLALALGWSIASAMLP